jgi:PAS domain S-box-containing protein
MLGWVGNMHKRINLRIKILLTTSLVVGLFTGLASYLIFSFHTRSELKQAAEYGRNLMENTYSTIKYPMSVGDQKTIGEQLKDIKGNMKGLEVYISDGNGDISYCSEESRIRTDLSRYLHSEEARKALDDSVKTGVAPEGNFIETKGQDVHLVTMKPLLNHQSCFECHDAKKKVLGAILVKQPINEVFASLHSGRNRLVLYSGLEVLGIILFLNFVIFTLITRRIRGLAAKTGLVSAGDLTVEVHDDARDSIGVLTRHFNQMIKNMRDRMEYANSLKLGISEPFIMVDPGLRVTHVNQAAADLIGVPLNQIQDVKLCEDLFRSNVCKAGCPVKAALDTGVAVVGQKVMVKHANGKDIPVVASSAVLKDSTGKILGAFEILRDIRAEVEAEAALRESRLQEERAKRSLQERVESLSVILRRVAEGDLTVRALMSGENDAMDRLVQKTNQTLDRMEELITQTKKAALTVVGGIRHIAEQNQSFAQRTEQQAAAMEEISATIEELISNVRQNTTNTQSADSLSKEAVVVAQAGGATVEKTIRAMADMAHASRKIGEMMDLINEITFQTNLLSINAAVEAARAGEQGRGFAVVANEVRSLAKKSSEASKDIRNHVRDIMETAASCRDWVTELENGFRKIIETIKQASDSLSEVSLATQESSAGIHQIGQGVREVSIVIEHNAALVDELAEAAEHFNDKATLLQTMTDKFVISTPPEAEVRKPKPKLVVPAGRKPARAGSTRAPIAQTVREEMSAGDLETDSSDDFFKTELRKGIEDF